MAGLLVVVWDDIVRCWLGQKAGFLSIPFLLGDEVSCAAVRIVSFPPCFSGFTPRIKFPLAGPADVLVCGL